MPFERREILFYLTELSVAVVTAASDMGVKLPKPDEVQILDAVHSRDFHSSFHDIQDRFRNVYMNRHNVSGLMFRVATKGFFKREQVVGFILPDTLLEEILFQACRDKDIKLPRAAKKKVIARDLAIGFEMVFDLEGLVLAD